MRKPLFIGLATFLVVGAAIWCISWYTQAQSTKKTVEHWIATINSNQQYLTYDSLETSGFPSHVTLTLTNPRFKGRIDELLKSFDKDDMLFPHQLPQWQQYTELQGTLTLMVNALSDHYKVEMTGKWLQDSTMDGKQLPRAVTTQPYSTACFLEMEKGTLLDNMWSLKLFDDMESFAKQFRSVDCTSSAYALVEEGTDAVYMQSGPSRFYLSKEQQGEHYHIRFYANYKDMEITQTGEELIEQYIKAISPDYFFPAMYADYGKQNAEIDFVYNGPNFVTYSKKGVPFEVNLGTFKLSNNLYSGSGHLHMKNESVSDDRMQAFLNTRFEFTYTPEYDVMLEKFARTFVEHAITTQDPELREIHNALNSYSPEQAFTLIKPAIPKLSPLGQWVQSANATYEGKKDYSAGNINLADFAFTMTPYGITGSGSAQKTDTSPFPEANFTFQCAACTVMVDDVSAYTNRVLQVIQNFYPEDPSYSYRISPALTQGIKQFMTELSSADAKANSQGNFTFSVTSDPTGNMMVSGRNVMDVMALYEKYIASRMVPSGEAGDSDIPTQGWKVE